MTFRLKWPTQFPGIIQRFGENKTGDPNFYKKFGLPAHEGLDFVAPTGSEIYACADGVISMIGDGRDGHAYGIQVRIKHPTPEGEYETIYAHLQKIREGVRPGAQIKAGELLGLADNTGHSRGEHLHLTVKKKGATARRETNYPKDIVDPLPLLDPFTGEVAPPKPKDNLSFVQDITVPDDTLLPAGAPFQKTWLVRNSGTTTWGEDYSLRFVSNTRMASVRQVALPPLMPGEEGTISIQMEAPSQPGRYKSSWQAHNAAGKSFGTVIFVVIRANKVE
jgi:hypothetical protein